jgi:hypothetical protein
MDWEIPSTKQGFAEFMGKYYPDKDQSDTLAAIDKYIKNHRGS